MKSLQIIIILIFIFIVLIFYKSDYNREVTYVTSDIDNKQYLVRDLDDKQQAANMLAKIHQNIMELTNHLVENKDTKYVKYKQYIEQLDQRIQNTIMNESTQDSVYTSYSVNKGEQIVFCLRSKKKKNKLHDLNLVMYVTLHELAHVGCPEQGHTDLFKHIFAFFTEVAIDIDIYHKVDFKKNPTEYCGLQISESII